MKYRANNATAPDREKRRGLTGKFLGAAGFRGSAWKNVNFFDSMVR